MTCQRLFVEFLLFFYINKVLYSKATLYRRNDCFDDMFSNDFESINKSFGKVHCAAICNSNPECISFSFRYEDKGCIPVEGMLDNKNEMTMQTGWEYYTSVLQSSDSCNNSGFKETFTEHKNMFHSGEDIRWYFTSGATQEDKIKECKQSCLSDSSCRGYELRLDSGICSIEAINKWDKDLEPHLQYIYFNRNYDCGCPPSQKSNIRVCYTSSMDGANVTYVCPKNYMRFTYMCTPDGWGIEENQISC